MIGTWVRRIRLLLDRKVEFEKRTKTMFARALIITVLAGLFYSTGAVGQTTTCGNTKLACLLPTAFHTNPPTFNFFNEAFGTRIAQLPLATPASGFLFTFDKVLGVYTDSQESFGPLLAERAETIGQHKLYLAFTYQRFAFTELDGNSLKNLPLVFQFPDAQSPQVVTSTTNRVDTKADQFVAFGTFGLTRSIDMSLAVPFEKISMGASATGTEFSTSSAAQASFTEFVSGSASGIGDLVISAKGTLMKGEHLGLAVGGEFRLPTGNEQNFLGSGAIGLKPYFVVASSGRFAPHLNVGYQWNAKSSLAADEHGKQNLPAFLSYAAGADIGIVPRLTVVADWIGQYYFNAPQISSPKSVSAMVNGTPQRLSSVVLANGSYQLNSLAVGLKANPTRHLLITANATFEVGDGGLRTRVVPLFGISYSFSDLHLPTFGRSQNQKCACPNE